MWMTGLQFGVRLKFAFVGDSASAVIAVRPIGGCGGATVPPRIGL